MQRRVAHLSAALVLAACAAATAAHGREGDGRARVLPELRAVSAAAAGPMSVVRIEATEPVAYVTSRPDPGTLVVDLRHVTVGEAAAGPLASPVAPFLAVHVEPAVAADGAPLARVRLGLARGARARVRASRNLILVEAERGSGAPAADTAAPAIGAQQGLATELRAVRAGLRDGRPVVALVGNGRLTASTIELARDLPPRLLLDFQGVSGAAVPAVTPVNQGGVARVRVGLNSRTPLVTRVVIDLEAPLPYEIAPGGAGGEQLHVLFGESPAVPGGGTAGGNEVSAAALAGPALEPARVQPAADREGAPAASVPRAVRATLGATRPAPPAGLQEAPPVGAQPPRFTGHPISLDFQGADLRAVLRTFAEISGLNVVIDPTIAGTVDVALRDVPWDQALDIILKANKLGYAVDGTVVRIAPLSVLADEEAQRRKLADEQALAGELQVLTHPLSYARAADMVAILNQSALSPRGQVQVDARTNTLIVRDLPDRLKVAAELITTLDRPQPQVEIEARIVQTTRDFARSLGVQWGASGTADARRGNTLPLAFPNTGSVQTNVNLPVQAPNSTVGVSLGSVNGAINLDAALSALERSGQGRLLSTPRVSTQNNVQAEITQGIQIPIQTVANNTVTVTFKDAALTLRVTPQITAADTVIMRIEVENAAADFSRQVNNIPPIDTQRALTTVLVADGETTVIGGIYVSREQASQGRTPVMSRIPLLGWLFRRDEISDESRELLIFITPRIKRG